MELQAIQNGGHGRAPGPKPVHEGQPETPMHEPAAQPSSSTRVPPHGRAEERGIEQRLADAQERTHGRLAAAIDPASLSPRQQQALEKVMAQFDQKLARLTQSMGGADGAASDLSGALEKVYGTLLDQLRDILGASHGSPKGGRDVDASGLALDTHA